LREVADARQPRPKSLVDLISRKPFAEKKSHNETLLAPDFNPVTLVQWLRPNPLHDDAGSANIAALQPSIKPALSHLIIARERLAFV
jgi:hypothetical protein